MNTERVLEVVPHLGRPASWISRQQAEQHFPAGTDAIKHALVSGIVSERYFRDDAAAVGCLSWYLSAWISRDRPGVLFTWLVGVVHYCSGNAWYKVVKVLETNLVELEDNDSEWMTT